MVKGKSPKIKVSVSKSTVSKFLDRKRVVEQGAPYTHVSFDPPGKYYIKDQELNEFFTVYCNSLIKKIEGLTIAEKPSAVGPFRIDVDLKTPNIVKDKKGEPMRYYTENKVKDIIRIIHSIIEEYVDLTNQEEYDADAGEDFSPYQCVFLEKPSARIEDGILKDGFHLHFPFFFVDSWTNTKIHLELNKRMEIEGIWKNTPFEEQKEILDSNASNYNTWMLYGSAKKANGTPYLAKHFYNPDLDEIKPEDFFAEDMEGRKSTAKYYLPRFMSIRGIKRATPLKRDILNLRDAEIRAAKRRATQHSVASTNNAQAAQELTMLQQGEIMNMISPERADSYREWYRIGQALYTVSHGGQEGLDMWIDFSKNWDRFKEGECEILWSKMKKNNWHIGWLLKCASQDSPDRYKEWRDQGIEHLIKKCLQEPKPTEWDLAQLFHKIFEKRFICANSKNKEWYEFKDHRWRKLDGILEVQRVLPTELISVFIDYKRRLLKKMRNDTQNSSLAAEEMKCGAVISHLKTNSFQRKVISQCEFLCHDSEFLAKKDENKNLWVCENGVLDLKEAIFRDGKPEDYCTYSCGLHYQEYENNDEDVKAVNKFFDEVFVNPNLKNFFLDNICSIMEGGNPQKSFIIGTGSGSNGKSITYSWVRAMCGDYCITFPQALFIMGNSDSSGAARPELSRIRGRRIAMVNELSKKDKINIRVLKELTGNDTFFGRGLYSEGGEIKPMFKLFMHTNEPPEMAGDDEASWERANFVDFQSKFVLPAKLKEWPVPKERDEQIRIKRFHADQTLADRADELAPAFLWMMFKRYKMFKQHPMVTPEEVTVATNKQRIKNDFYQQFVEDRLEKVTPSKRKREEGEEDSGKKKKKEPLVILKIAEAHTAFNEWFKETHPQALEKVSQEHFRIELSKKIGNNKIKGRTKYWAGWKIAEEDDEEGGGDEEATEATEGGGGDE